MLKSLSMLPKNKGLHLFEYDLDKENINEIYSELKEKGLVYVNETEEDGIIAAGLTITGLKVLKELENL